MTRKDTREREEENKEGGEGGKNGTVRKNGPEILNPGDVAALTKYCFCQLSSHHLSNSGSSASTESFAGICCGSTGRSCQHGFAEVIIKAKTGLCYPSVLPGELTYVLPAPFPATSEHSPGAREKGEEKLQEVWCFHPITGCKWDLAAVPRDYRAVREPQAPPSLQQ